VRERAQEKLWEIKTRFTKEKDKLEKAWISYSYCKFFANTIES